MNACVSAIEKLKDKFNRKPVPNDITHADVIRLAEYYNCEIYTGGKHPIRIVDKESGTVIPIPVHDKCVKEAYIKELKDLFNIIEERRN